MWRWEAGRELKEVPGEAAAGAELLQVVQKGRSGDRGGGLSRFLHSLGVRRTRPPTGGDATWDVQL